MLKQASFLGFFVTATVGAACLVDRPSEQFECSVATDCSLGRVCEAGYCVVQNCPPDCTRCDQAMRTCEVECTSSDRCGDISCPIGWTCTISCLGTGACDDITCDNDSECEISCNGPGACQDVDCTDSCRCDLDCPTGSCDLIDCPAVGGGGNTLQCTVDGTSQGACDSSRDARCNSC